MVAAGSNSRPIKLIIRPLHAAHKIKALGDGRKCTLERVLGRPVCGAPLADTDLLHGEREGEQRQTGAKLVGLKDCSLASVAFQSFAINFSAAGGFAQQADTINWPLQCAALLARADGQLGQILSGDRIGEAKRWSEQWTSHVF